MFEDISGDARLRFEIRNWKLDIFLPPNSRRNLKLEAKIALLLVLLL